MIQERVRKKQNMMHMQKRQDDNDNNLLVRQVKVKSGQTWPDLI